VGDDSVFKKYGEQLGLVGTWWSGQEHRVLSGIDGVLLVVVIGDGKLVVPLDLTIRRPASNGPGAPCRDKVLFYTSRVICKRRLTMEEIIFSLKHYWRIVDCETLELKALS
jgi:hypothetical protein